jgi:hypothetical protein
LTAPAGLRLRSPGSGRSRPRFSRRIWPFVFAAEEVAALQFGADPVDEIVKAAWNPRGMMLKASL